MLLRFTLSITLPILGLPNEATLMAETRRRRAKARSPGRLR